MAEPDELTPAQLMPRRNPRLIDRIAARLFRADPAMGPQPAEQETTQSGVLASSLTSIYDQFFKSQSDRQAVYNDADEMDKVCEEAQVAMDTIADNIVTSEDGTQMSFSVVSENPQVQDTIDDTIASSDLHHKVRPIARNLVKYGDYFGEIVVNGAAQIVDLKSLRASQMYRNQDAKGNLKIGAPKYDPKSGKCLSGKNECAFEQRNQDDQEIAATFWPWQIIHIRHNHDDLQPYGKSMLDVTRVIWRKLKALEEALIIGRLTRDILKLVFYIDTTGLSQAEKQTALAQFKQSITQAQRMDGRRENPYQVYTDFFFTSGYVKHGGQVQPSLTKVDTIDPKNEGIHNIEDILYHHRKLLMTLRVPPAHLGWEKDVSAKGVLTQQDVQYVRWLRSVQQEIGQGLEQFFDTALVLKGLDPKDPNNAYQIAWPALKATDEAAAAQTELARAQSDQLYVQEGVISPQWIRTHRFGMTDEDQAKVQVEVDANEQAKLQRTIQEGMAARATEEPAAAGSGQSAHRDMDGKRKGDEGRDRNGKRIPATQNKTSNNPTGKRVSQEIELLVEQIRPEHPNHG